MLKAVFVFLQKVHFHTIVFLAGILLVFVSVFRADNLAKWQIAAYATPIYTTLVLGAVLIVAAMVVYAVTMPRIWESTEKPVARIIKGSDRVVAEMGDSSITVTAGRLEESITDPAQVLVVLPANEYFNDRCINDRNTALGAFVQAKYPGRTREFESAIRSALHGKASKRVKVGNANFAPRMRQYVPRSWLSTPWLEPSSKSLASGCLTSSDVADGSSRVARTARRTA
jgi:hypothetical protein